MAVEEAEAGLRDAEANMETIVASRGDEHRDLLDEKKTLEAQLTEMQSQRSGIATEIDTDHMQLYESMRSRKHNQPIALMEGNTCGICGVAQTISIEQAVRQGSSLVHCSNCDRILVYRP